MSTQTIRLAKRRIVEVVLDSSFFKGKTQNAWKYQAWSSEGEDDADDDDNASSYADSAKSSGEDDETDVNVPSSSVLTPQSVSPGAHYSCPYASCGKSYTKACRLAEHIRSHTGERPFKCDTCGKSYLRESHLQAHVRSHLPESQRPIQCTQDGCSKRFWTSQHLKYHVFAVHMNEKPFHCTENGCEAAFSKNHQLRQHIAEMHSPAGTKPYRCPVENCTKSFATNQKLRSHSKTHEDRYACTDPACRTANESASSTPLYFTTWSALQMHLRQKHPPTCPYDECNRRTFTKRGHLRNHLKLHEEKEVARGLAEAVGANPNVLAKERRGGELGRKWSCAVEGCAKAFKSKQALTVHNNITHLGRRDFVCAYPNCGKTFGYKHLLQRHEASVHLPPPMPAQPQPQPQSEDIPSSSKSHPDIDWITGKEYTTRSAHNNTRRPLVHCPWPNRFNLTIPIDEDESIEKCGYIFSRAYDLRRHLRAAHSLELTKEEVDDWVKSYRELRST